MGLGAAVQVCVAGKNSISTRALQEAVDRVGSSAVVALPNRADDGAVGWQPSLRAEADALGVRIVTLVDVLHVRNLLFLSLEFDQLIKPSNFKTERLFNIHFSLLPAYRGMYTSAWPLLTGAAESGVTLHYIDAGIDTGDVVASRSFPISPDHTCRDLYMTYLDHGTHLLVEHLDALLDFRRLPLGTPQSASGASYYSKTSIDYGSLRIDLRKTAWEIKNQIRAFVFREYQMPELFGKPVCCSKIADQRSVQKPGSIVSESDLSFTVSTVDFDVEVFLDVLPDFMLHAARHDPTTCLELLPGIMSPDETDTNGETPLIAAVRAGDVTLVERLLDMGATPTLRTWRGTTAFDVARDHQGAGGGRRELIALLESRGGAESRGGTIGSLS